MELQEYEYEAKYYDAEFQNKKLRRANSNLKNEVRELRRELEKMRSKQKKKGYYKNGRRGTQFNG